MVPRPHLGADPEDPISLLIALDDSLVMMPDDPPLRRHSCLRLLRAFQVVESRHDLSFAERLGLNL